MIFSSGVNDILLHTHTHTQTQTHTHAQTQSECISTLTVNVSEVQHFVGSDDDEWDRIQISFSDFLFFREIIFSTKDNFNVFDPV